MLCAALATPPAPAEAIELEWVMYRDPILLKPTFEKRFPEGLVDLWLLALERPERDLKRRAAAAIIEAHEKGLPGLEATIDPLIGLVKDPDEDRVVRLTAARTLVALDARQAARALFQSAHENDLDMAEAVEPALARWAFAPVRDRWRERLDGEIGLHRMHVLAIRGLAALEDRDATPAWRRLAENRHAPAGVRFEAADALGVVAETGLLPSARVLSTDKSPGAFVDRLVAAKMLAGHRGDDSERLLIELATDPQPSVQAVALNHLLRIDPKLILPVIGETTASDDANVRRLGAEALIALASPETIPLLVPMLDDRDPGIRRHVCDRLLELSRDPSLSEPVLIEGRRLLAAEGWRGQEQATLLLATLDDKTITGRLLELLDSPRPEVHVTAAWGLCRLAVPSTAAPLLRVLEERTRRSLAELPQSERIDHQSALLAQAMGILKHRPADAVLREYLPKETPLTDVSRAAALWALGHLHAGQPEDRLAEQLQGRLLDYLSEEPESSEVCCMAAVSLGRIQAAQSLPALRRVADSLTVRSPLGYACVWAIHQLAGEEIPRLEPVTLWEDDWFLKPTQKP